MSTPREPTPEAHPLPPRQPTPEPISEYDVTPVTPASPFPAMRALSVNTDAATSSPPPLVPADAPAVTPYPPPPAPSADDREYLPLDTPPGIPVDPASPQRRPPTSSFSRRRYLTEANLDPRTFHNPIGAGLVTLLAETLVAVLATLLAAWCWRLAPESWGLVLTADGLLTTAMAALVLPLINLAVGLYPGYGLGGVQRLRLRAIVAGVTLLLMGAMAALVPGALAPVATLVLGLVLGLPLMPIAERAARSFLMWANWWGTPVIILGHGEAVARIVGTLKDHPVLGWRPVAILDDERSGTGHLSIAGVPVVGGFDKAGDFRHIVDTALVALPAEMTTRLVELSERLPFPRVILVPELSGMQTLWVSACDLGGALGLQVRKQLLLRSNRIVKLMMDYAVVLPALLAAAPVIAGCALWIKLVDRGPAFYAQEREGYRGRRIRVWKLRTMYVDNQGMLERHLNANPAARAEWEKHFKLRNDPRVLPYVGWLLRRASLDELPQLWNVVRGDMSLVGPRPFPHYHLERFDARFRNLRCSVRPGLTGLWQVGARSEGDLRVQELQDTYYIRNWSLWLDVHIIIRTLSAVVRGSGAY